MATIVLAAAGAAIGGAVGGSVLGIGAAAIGQAIGASVGGVIDQAVFGQGSAVVQTGRVDKFRLQSAAEGASVARTFGRMRVAGQMIWSSNFTEQKTTSRAGGKGSSRGVTTEAYSYSISCAFAVGEGEIVKIGRIWADGQEIAKETLNITVHTGTQTQLPDPVISAAQGIEHTPAFRGTAYIVFEDLDLTPFGNRIPQFNFEVFRNAQPAEVSQDKLGELIEGVCLIPGSGEYSLSTTAVHFPDDFAAHQVANTNSSRGGTDFVNGIEDLISEAPNCQSVSVVVSWFGSDLRCDQCELRPKVEQNDVDGDPQEWRVSGLARDTAQTVGLIDGQVSFGGTPCDASVLEAINHLKSKGQGIVFYPFILMDIQENNALTDPWSGQPEQPVMPWRGRITSSLAPDVTGSPDMSVQAEQEVSAFFGSVSAGDFSIANGVVTYSGPDEWSYRRFILHNAALCAAAGGVDAFCIGSEMRSLTQIRGDQASFPAVDALIALATEVRSLLGPDVKIGYAADWSEYFGYHPQDGSGDVYFHLDPLWASPNIDFIGIDNYMPLSDWRDTREHSDKSYGSIYNKDYLQANIEGGEGYDWYYRTEFDRETQTRTPITDGAHAEAWVYRYKDIKNWWANEHHNRVGGVRDSQPTTWVPQSKPIWFTELGCPAIDKGTNQPNVFVDPKSSESAMPYFSNGQPDELMQRAYLDATLSYWNEAENNPVSSVYGETMIDCSKSHVWAWDARPWPEFPARSDVWSDAANYAQGHWVNGRLLTQSLGFVVGEICETAGFVDYDVSGLRGVLTGYAIDGLSSVREMLQPLMQAFDFSCFEDNGHLVFFHNKSDVDLQIHLDQAAFDIDGEGHFSKSRKPVNEVPSRVRLNFYDPDLHYQVGEVEALLASGSSAFVSELQLPLALSHAHASSFVQKWAARTPISIDTISLALPLSKLSITCGDVLEVISDHGAELYRVDTLEEQGARKITASRIIPEIITDPPLARPIAPPKSFAPAMPVLAQVLDLPLLSETSRDYQPYLCATATPWNGVAVYAASADDGFELYNLIKAPSVMGQSLSALARAQSDRWANQQITVRVSDTTLSSASELEVFNGANAFAMRNDPEQDWEIIQFRSAELIGQRTYVLSGLLRGQLGTDAFIPDVWDTGAEIVFLNGEISQLKVSENLIGNSLNYRAGPAIFDYTNDAFKTREITLNAVGRRPYAPAHLKCASATDGSKTITWTRRTRIGGDSWAGIEVPLSEEIEHYKLCIFDGPTLIREVSTTSPSWTYSSAQQLADNLPTNFDITVAQISAQYGAGPETRITING